MAICHVVFPNSLVQCSLKKIIVLSKSDETGEVSYRQVVNTFIRQTDAIYKVAFTDGTTLETTWNHPFRVLKDTKDKEFNIENTQWTQAKDLVSGDVALSANGARLQIVSIEIDDRAETVYNFEVEDFHTYFVGEVGVWVHNAEGYQEFRKNSLANSANINPSLLSQLDPSLATMYEKVKAEHGESVAKEAVSALLKKVSVNSKGDVIAGALDPGSNSGLGNIITGNSDFSDIDVTKFSYKIVEDKSSGKDENGKPLKKVIIDVDESKGGKPKLYFTLESSDAPISHNGMGQEVRRESQRQYWLETFEIDIQNKQTRAVSTGSDNFLKRPFAELSPESQRQIIKFNFDSNSGNSTPDEIDGSMFHRRDPRVHGSKTNLHDNMVGPNGGASTAEILQQIKNPQNTAPSSSQRYPHIVLPFIGIQGGIPVPVNRSVILKIIDKNNCKSGDAPGQCTGGR